MAKRVTEEEALEVKRLYVDEKLSTQAIAIKVGRTQHTVRNILHRTGVAVRSSSCNSKGRSAFLPRARHGMSGHPLYQGWVDKMKYCYNPKRSEYKNYGARGIEVFGPWHDPRVYIEYVEAVLGPKPGPEYSIDRIETNGDYKPGNIQWADKSTQNRNRDFTRNA